MKTILKYFIAVITVMMFSFSAKAGGETTETNSTETKTSETCLDEITLTADSPTESEDYTWSVVCTNCTVTPTLSTQSQGITPNVWNNACSCYQTTSLCKCSTYFFLAQTHPGCDIEWTFTNTNSGWSCVKTACNLSSITIWLNGSAGNAFSVKVKNSVGSNTYYYTNANDCTDDGPEGE